ncbi:ectonucleotide pyrophosphatase/phosphodiesterase [Emticicia sp. BO119]|uniref:alkaline phosphatase family protein n=1 Tax=Emticicia sp. BO119 TaxID=2757768 RepID=UPI0015F05663|nr:ectonucleotide pyrophosphatase/phosphodiesterase [Emticicia sp. BO119]MBA4853145.1 alkaline phosphatase family protein [Emticicia sp. BO119]
MSPLLRYVFACLLLFFFNFSAFSQSKEVPYIVMVSFDGFRHDYVQKYNPKHIKKFIKKGSAATKMFPSYPSKTFPNHYTLVTGLYPAHHGLVDNTFYDVNRDTFYSIRQRDKVEDPYYYGGIPIWQLVQQNGMKAASYFWVGSEAPVGGTHPTYYHIYDEKVSNKKRVQGVFDWLNLPEPQRPHLITVYFSMVDTQGHEYGPDASETKAAVMEADSLVGMLMKGLKKIDLPVNVILTSDHGMYEMKNEADKFIYIEDLLEGLNKNDFVFVNSGTHANIFLKNKTIEESVQQSIATRQNHFKVYKKADIPQNLHYNDHPRIGDLTLIAEAGYSFYSRESLAKRPMTKNVWGAHGFDPYTTPEMGAIFYAKGPNVKKRKTIPEFQNIHVYPFVASLLGIPVPPNIDGDVKVLQGIIKK